MLTIPGCAHKFEKQDKEIISVVIHARSKHDIEVLLPILLRYSSPILADAKVHLRIVETNFDVPKLSTKYEDLDEFLKYDDGNVHVFFVHEYIKFLQVQVAGVRFSENLCSQVIIITDKTSKTTLAHEIGHFFGLYHHSDHGNIMHSGKRDKWPLFNYSQINKMHANIEKRKQCEY